MKTAVQAQTFRFGEAGAFPNNPTLPALLYKHTVSGAPDEIADWFDREWARHGWSAEWRWGVYPFPHYHSTAHEILGVYRGHATLRLGHTVGVIVEVEPGDVIVLPAGTVHQNLGSSADFHVVGGYPEGQDADLLRGSAGERPAADEQIARVPLPTSDPVAGDGGPLVEAWGLKTAGS
jgi:uncharacterized protein YjlB